MSNATHTPGPWRQNNDENGQCRYCGRDNRGHEHEMCSEDCPYEIARAEAPAMLEALRVFFDTLEAWNATGPAMDNARAILARIDGEAN